MKQILVSGSTAYDIHMRSNRDISEVFNGENTDGITLSTTSDIYEKYNGGTGANISYNLGLLGENAILLSASGKDFYQNDLIKEKINLKYYHTSQILPTPTSIIIHDSSNTKMEFFYAGAMLEASDSKIEYVEETLGAAIVSANHIPTMLEHARKLQEKNIPLIIDPAQQTTQMSREELRVLLSYGNILIANHYELADISNISGYEEDELHDIFETVIITYGAQGSNIFHKGENFHIPAIEVEDADDTTGAGDAYRAGVLYGIIEGWNMKTSCQLGTLLASYCIYTPGSQNHHVSLGTLGEEMLTKFGVTIDFYSKRKY